MLSTFLDKRVMRPTALALLAAFALLILPVDGLVPRAKADALADLNAARDHYEFAEFDQGVTILEGLLAEKKLSGDALRDAYVLLARCYVGKGNEPQALDTFCQAICLDKTWRPDAVYFPQDEIEVFNKALEGCDCSRQSSAPAVAPVKTEQARAGDEEGGGIPKWVYYAGGAVVVGVIAALALGGGDDSSEPPLAGFPDPPAN
jgi:hypothetical protein